MAAIALLHDIPNPTEADVLRGMSGNLCRCGTYPKIVRAFLAAARSNGADDAKRATVDG
jgi:aerobic-type carbon monoxide dehydrogenase small subunit (CoxS/CutS family)